jgi:hypothetical protein
MIAVRSGSARFGRSGLLGTRRELCLVALLAVVFIPLRAECSDDFTSLFTGSSLEHSLGDIDALSYQDGHLVAKTDSARTERVFLLRQERFGNFILKFQARSDGATLNVLFRSIDMPPGQLLGFEPGSVAKAGGASPFESSGALPHRPPRRRQGSRPRVFRTQLQCLFSAMPRKSSWCTLIRSMLR